MMKGTRFFYALLSCALGEQLVWFLANHKAYLGRKMLGSVTVWTVDSCITLPKGNVYSNPVKWPVVIWEVVDYDPQLVESKKRIEAKWTTNPFHLPDIRGMPLAYEACGKTPRVALPLHELKQAEGNVGNTVYH